MNAVLLDTGFLVALFDRHDSKHGECAEILASLDCALITCETVIAESAYLLRRCNGAAEQIMKNIEKRVFEIPWRLIGNESRLKKLFLKYGSQKINLSSACLILMAEDFSTGDILTLDSNFLFYRWNKTKRFRIFPHIT
ncbi:MAG TPA: PIN domain-containing protein [Turneriella sp.]|nr:PIN domain-containing protein [Turneriella sp.]